MRFRESAPAVIASCVRTNTISAVQPRPENGAREAAKLIEVEHLSKLFKNFKAVDDVSFEVREGEMVGLLGPNGAGKTTIVHMMLGLISTSAGEVRIFGKPFEANREEILQNLNFTSPYMAFPARLTVKENLNVFAGLYGVRNREAKISHLMKKFAIEELRDKPISRLSSGENTRVGLCKAFMNDPKLLLLDEPTAYLDPQVARQVRDTLLEMQQRMGTTILYTSHNMAEVEAMCGRIILLSHGRIIATGSPIEVTQIILKEERVQPALEEVFLHIAARGRPDEVA
jgi:ABC-2 type transport system ATP-binding protein